MAIKIGYELSDVLLIPKHSAVDSRSKVDLSVKLKGLDLRIPIIASPMSGIIGVDFIKEIGRLGGIGILHRFYNNQEKRFTDLNLLTNNATNFGVAVGLNDSFYREACVGGASILCIDISVGYLDSVLEFTSQVATYITKNGFNCLLMAGNVCTWDGARNLYRAGAELIRVGTGPCRLCRTRRATGIGVPQWTAIQDCSYLEYPYQELGRRENKVRTDWTVIADGGIRDAGDAVKALGAGGDLIMAGSMFGRCFESDNDGEIYGSASRELQEEFYGKVQKSVEGSKEEVVKDISLEDFLAEFIWDMKSGFSHCGCFNIEDLHKNAEFITVGRDSIR